MTFENAQQFVLFFVAAKRCALPLTSVAEIVSLPSLSHPPGLPAIVEGFLNLRGQRIPVLRLERLFNFPVSEFGPYQHVILIKDAAATLALLVDYVAEIRRMPDGWAAPLQAQRVIHDCTVWEASLDDQPLYILAADRLLLDEERRRLSELQALEQERVRRLEKTAG